MLRLQLQNNAAVLSLKSTEAPAFKTGSQLQMMFAVWPHSGARQRMNSEQRPRLAG